MQKIPFYFFTLALSSSILLTSCNANTDTSKKNPLDLSNFNLPEGTKEKIESQFYSLQDQLTSLLTDISQRYRNETINLREPVPFHLVYSNAGIFYVKTQSLDKVQNGSRVKLQIGNPLAADFSEVSVKIKWMGPKKDKKAKVQYEKSVQISELASSTWKEAEIMLMPVESDSELDKVVVEITVGQVKLMK